MCTACCKCFEPPAWLQCFVIALLTGVSSQGSDLFDPRLLKNVIKMVDVSYGGEAGFNQAIELSAETLGSVKLVQVCFLSVSGMLTVLNTLLPCVYL